MKNLALVLVILCCSSLVSFGQVNFESELSLKEDGTVAHPSAMLDVAADDRGVLIPRMTFAQIGAIANPANGLLVFATSDNCFYFNEGTSAAPVWTSLCDGGSDDDPTNELQTLNQSGSTITLSDGGGSFDLSFESADFVTGFGSTPTATRAFLVVPETIDVQGGEKVHITSHKALGTTNAAGAGSLDLWICYRAVGDTLPPSILGSGSYNQAVPANTRVTLGLSAVWSVPSSTSGSYQCGLCGDDDGNGNWTSNEFGYTTVLIFND